MLCYGKLDSEVSRRVGRGFAAAVTQATGTSATAGCCACPERTRCRVAVNISLRSACRIAAPRCMYACMYVCRSVRPSVCRSLAASVKPATSVPRPSTAWESSIYQLSCRRRHRSSVLRYSCRCSRPLELGSENDGATRFELKCTYIMP